MDQELQKLIRQLQDEKCPPTVLDRVAQHTSRGKMSGRSSRHSLRWAVSITCLFGVVVLWQQQQARREAQRVTAERAAAQVQANRALVMQQTQDAFGYIGQALIRAAAHTENALLKGAVPALRTSFEIAKNKVTNPI